MTHLRPEDLDTLGQMQRAQDRARLGRVVLALGLLLVLLAPPLLGMGTVDRLMQDPSWRAYLRGQPAPDAFLSCAVRVQCLAAVNRASRVFYRMPLWAPAALGAVLMLAGGMVLLGASRARPKKLPGMASFAKNWHKFLRGISYLGVKEGKVLRYPGDKRFKHTLILGNTGAGKTSRLIRPMLAYSAKEGRSAVVIDLKWPDVGLLGMTSVFRKLGRRVIVLLPYDPRSPRLPLMRGAEDERVAQKLAEVIIPVQEQEDVTSYYKNMERELLLRLIHIEARHGRGSFGEIRAVCQNGPEALEAYINSKAPDAKRYFGFFFAMSKRDQANIVGGLVNALKTFGDPLVDRFTSRGPGEVDLRVIAKEPTLVYVGIPQERLQDAGGQPLLQLFKRYLDWTLLEMSQETGRLEVPVEVYLDEFTNLGYLPRMSDNLSTMRSRQVAYILALQSFEQGLERYPKEVLESILANCNTWIIMPSGLGDEDAVRVSKALGRTTSYAPSESVSTPHAFDFGHPWPRYTQGERWVDLPLLSPEEMLKLGPETVILRFADNDPLVVNAPRFDEVLTDPKAPEELKALANLVAEAERDYRDAATISPSLAADYLIADHLLPVIEVEEEADRVIEVAAGTGKERLFAWAAEALRGGASFALYRAPEDPSRITKLSIRPPGGLPPETAGEWEKARWVKLEKGKAVVSLVPPVLEEFARREPLLMGFMDFLGRLEKWLEKNADKLEGHPAFKEGEGKVLGRWKGDRVVLPLDVLAELGIDPKEAEKYGREVRWQNRRGFVEVPLSVPGLFQLVSEA